MTKEEAEEFVNADYSYLFSKDSDEDLNNND